MPSDAPAVTKANPCSFGPARVGTVDGPASVKAGSAASFTAHFTPGDAFTTYEWFVVDPVTLGRKQQFPTDANSPTTTLYLEGGERDVKVYVIATTSPNSGAQEVTAEALGDVVHIGCSALGQDCSAFGSCCVSPTSCHYDTNHTCQ
ncbi:MAG: hypothetical protein ABIP39_16430 [Polyangiaceae bacterium]